MFNPFNTSKKPPAIPDAAMLRKFIEQISKLSPSEKAFVKKMVGSKIKGAVSLPDVERAFTELETHLSKDLTPEELRALKRELILFFE